MSSRWESKYIIIHFNIIAYTILEAKEQLFKVKEKTTFLFCYFMLKDTQVSSELYKTQLLYRKGLMSSSFKIIMTHIFLRIYYFVMLLGTLHFKDLPFKAFGTLMQ